MEKTHEAQESSGNFKRTMKARHLIMLSLGGVIGTGLFYNTGGLIATAGPFGTLLAYAAGALMIYAIMQSLGELSVAMPVTGSIHTFASKFISPGTGFVMALLYMLTWIVGMGTNLLASSFAMSYWFPGVDNWVWCAAFLVLLAAMNLFSTKLFAESEFFFSLIKVVMIQLVILFGGLAIFGVLPLSDGSPAPYFSGLSEHGLLPNGFAPVLAAMTVVTFAFLGTELIGVAAGETESPERVIPMAIRTTVIRLVFFFMGTVLVLACLVPTDAAGVTKSPFIVVFERIGIPYATDILNFVILSAVLSAANSGLYAAGRMIWSMAYQGMLPAALKKQNAHGVPVNALIVALCGGMLALLSAVFAPDTVLIALTSITGFSALIVWFGICLSHYNFRRRFVAEGNDLATLKYRAPLFPFLPILGMLMCGGSLLGIVFDERQQTALWVGIPIVVAGYVVHALFMRRRAASLELAEAGAQP